MRLVFAILSILLRSHPITPCDDHRIGLGQKHEPQTPRLLSDAARLGRRRRHARRETRDPTDTSLLQHPLDLAAAANGAWWCGHPRRHQRARVGVL